GLMLLAAIGLYLVIRAIGESLSAPPAAEVSFGGLASEPVDVMHVLLALVVVIVMARGVGSLFRVFHQPPVVGEIIAGIMLGPSLLGRIAPGAQSYLFPHSVVPFLNVLSQVGVILYMFLVGLELDPGLLRRRGHATVAISHASIIAPFLLGGALALLLYPRLSTADVPFTCFSLFLGVSMSVTAFPVLARILTDRMMHKTRMGAVALTCAAVDDVTAWCLLAFVVGVVESRTAGALWTGAFAIAYVLVMLLAVRPAMGRVTRVYGNRGRLTQGLMALVFVVLLLSSVATDLIGIHAIFGAFAFGAVIPHDSGFARDLTDRLEDLVVVLLLPAFFAFTGLHTQIGLVKGADQWIICALITLVASLGKFGGTSIAARATGLGWRDASALGVLMNTRGLMELIVLNIGLDLGVISPELFAMLVLMALVTTFATTPILHVLSTGQEMEKEAEAERGERTVAAAASARRGTLVPIANPEGVVPLLEVALATSGANDPPLQLLALVRVPPGGVRSGLRELQQAAAPYPPVLWAALEHVRRRRANVVAQSVWSSDPATDIVRAANLGDTEWILMGSHRPVFGTDFRGGVVREVLEHASHTPVNVGVVLYGDQAPLDRVVAVLGSSTHGRVALELAAHIAQRRQCTLRTVLVPGEGAEPDASLLEMVKQVGQAAGRWMHTDVLSERSALQLSLQARGPLIIVAMDVVDDLGLPLDGVHDPEPHVIVVQASQFASASDTTPESARGVAVG
ncbi:MAG TPA: cation:proton antiporter, partial [Candidatus Binataceae bacterium]|nr:cation:proton antiporter [Candidatus Binataceae bacterium]